MSAPGVTVEVDTVSKWFRDLVAISDVSFTLTPGVTALLGPNGAGKSTMLRVLCGLTAPSKGSVRVLGSDPRSEVALMRRIGLVPQQESLFENLTGLDFVGLAAAMHGLPNQREASLRAMRLVALDPDDKRPVRAYSKGMRQRIKVAHGLVHDPEIVVLDEPLEGLDPRQRLRLIELFRRLGDEMGRTVLVSSHVLEEVERFGSRVLVMAEGRLVAEGDFRAIRELMDDRPHRLRVRTDRPRDLAGGLLLKQAVVGAHVVEDDTVVVDTTDVSLFRTTVATVAKDHDARLYELVPLDDDLESVFRYLVSRR